MSRNDNNKFYNDIPKRTTNMNSAYKIESKTRQYPFVIASEIKSISKRENINQSLIDSKAAPSGSIGSSTSISSTSIYPTAGYSSSVQIQTHIIPRRNSKGKEELDALSDEEVPNVRNKQSIEQVFMPKQTNIGRTNPLLVEPADEMDNVAEESANREFFVFHDVEHFLTQRDDFLFCHEIIRTPTTVEYDDSMPQKKYKDDLCKGRLIFDFDLKEPLVSSQNNTTNNHITYTSLSNGTNFGVMDPSTFVPANFKQIMEWLILETFSKYYVRVDTSKLLFIWQITRHTHKFSMHLIVKNAYFDEYWTKQMRVFYELLKYTAENNGLSLYMKTIDWQIPRRNATFRMIGSSKIGGKTLEIDSCRHNNIDLLPLGYQLTIYECLVGIYNVDHLQQEQHITMYNLNYDEIEDILDDNLESEQTQSVKDFRRVMIENLFLADTNPESIDLDDTDIAKSVELFELWNDGSFQIRDQVGNIINLDRMRRSLCPLSGRMHDNENSYLKLDSSGRVLFFCRRGCSNKGVFSIDLGFYRLIDRVIGRDGNVVYTGIKKRDKGIIPLKVSKLAMAQDAKTIIIDPNIQSIAPKRSPANTTNSSTTGNSLISNTPLFKPLKTSTDGAVYKPTKKNMGSSARRVPMGIDTVQIPSELRSALPVIYTFI